MLCDFFQRQMTELGKIKIGGKGATRQGSRGPYRLPEKHDYFTITTLNRDQDDNLIPNEELMAELCEQYGSPDDHLLREYPVRLMSNDPEQVMQTALLWYNDKKLGARCLDRKQVEWFYDRQTLAKLATPRVEDWNDDLLLLKNRQGGAMFKIHSTFNCVIAARQARWAGVYKFRTTSVISGKQLYNSLLDTNGLTNGVLVGMPLFLVVRPKLVSPQGKTITVYVVHVELRAPSMEAIEEQAVVRMRYMLSHAKEMKVIETQYKRLALPPGQETDAAEVRDIAEEFQPDGEQLQAGGTTDEKRADVQDATFARIMGVEASGLDAAGAGRSGEPNPTAPITAAPAPAPESNAPEEAGKASPGQPETHPGQADAQASAANEDFLADSKKPAADAPKPPPAMIGKDQIEEIQKLSVTLKLTKAQCSAMLEEFQAGSLSKLTAADALTLVIRLRKQRDEENKKRQGRGDAKPSELPPDCPKCKSMEHVVEGKKAMTWECTECKTVFEE